VSYSYQDYWRALHQRKNLSAVGQSSLSEDINKWIYRSTRRNLSRFARRHNLRAKGSRRMLEVGVGTGYWVDFWQKLGWTVDGCDLVPAAVDALTQRHPAAQFWQADVSSSDGLLDQSGGIAAEGYDLVTATNVLLHVTEDEAFARALANVAAAVKPGGHLLLVEPALTMKKQHAPYHPARSSRARVLAAYRKPLRDLGLKLVTVEPTTILAANPLEASSKRKLSRYQAWWRLVAKSRQRPSTVRWVGPAMYVLDALLMRTKEAPTSKILLFRRPRRVSRSTSSVAPKSA
jgi:2-polyprenyl-3-methyl-5-hydroxy-6-metoxy-1,4-benzoquinol methylase